MTCIHFITATNNKQSGFNANISQADVILKTLINMHLQNILNRTFQAVCTTIQWNKILKLLSVC